MCNHIPLLSEFINGSRHSSLSILCETKIFDNFPPAIFTIDGVGEAEAFWYSVLSRAHDCHAGPLAVCSVNPVTDMIHCSVTSRNSTRQPSQLNNLTTSTLHPWNKLIISPFLSRQTSNFFTLPRAVS
jgi:hypothetical protein